MNENFGFESLELWKKVRVFKIEICRIARLFPADEKFKLIDQIIRSVRSINALISEGQEDLLIPIKYICILARGSLSETINHLIDAFDDKYITEIQLRDLKIKGKEIELIINGYIIFLRKKRDEGKGNKKE
ncbi:MAG: four helix bundle protein [Ferruginibacter sp.]